MAVLVGTVTDSATGAPVSDALVTVTSPNLQGEEIAVTDSTGTYRVPGLPPGLYTLRVELQSYRPYAREELDLHADTTIRLNASLLPESLKAEEVVVVGRTPTVDIGSSATGLNITNEFTSRVPLIAPGGKGSAGRSFEAVADVVPGISGDAYGSGVFGSSSPEN
ncbi:MAG: oar1, partial [Myxococcaceae bacterium]|nr:oar1 [Myxococcaceae bacterium]